MFGVHRPRHADADGVNVGARKLTPAGVDQRIQNRVGTAVRMGGKRFVKLDFSVLCLLYTSRCV